MPRLKYTKETNYRGYPVNQNGEKIGLIVQYLDRVIDMTEAVLTIHRKVYAIRFDLRFPANFKMKDRANGNWNEYVSKFFKSLNYRLTSMKNKKGKSKGITHPAHAWAREIESSSNPHYHCILLINASKTSMYPVRIAMQEIWAKVLGDKSLAESGLIEWCDDYGERNTILDSGSTTFKKDVDDFIFHSSYITKTRTKPGVEAGVEAGGASDLARSGSKLKDGMKNFDGSRIKPRAKYLARLPRWRERQALQTCPKRDYRKCVHSKVSSIINNRPIVDTSNLKLDPNETHLKATGT